MRSLILLTLFWSSLSLAKTYEVNSQHSFVNFELDYMQVSRVKGAFEEFEGMFKWDGSSLSDLEFRIKVNSINTRDAKRDNHLRRKDFFFVNEFPVISFKGEVVTYNEAAAIPVKVTGVMDLRGVKRQHTFDLKWKGEYPDPVDKNKRSLFLTATTTIDRKDYNIRWNKALDKGGWVVGDKVEVEVIIEANPTDARPAFSRFYRKTTKLLPGKLKAPGKSALVPKEKVQEISSPEKKSPKKVTNKALFKGGLSLVFGFILFCAMCVVSYFLKKYLQEQLEKKLTPFWSEFISDTILYSFILGAAILLAPFMGYQSFF